jgi:uncharacterized protein (DUF2267 family)
VAPRSQRGREKEINMSRLHVFDSYLEVANRWLKELSTRLELAGDDTKRAAHALRAGLHAIRDRLPASEVLDLGAQLPTLIRGIYFEGWTLRNDPTEVRSRSELVARVETELRGDAKLAPIDVLRAVMQLLIAHVTAGEIAHMKSTLPRTLATLWDDVQWNETRIPTKPRARKPFVRHTGYSR